jgi:hypothetical protein
MVSGGDPRQREPATQRPHAQLPLASGAGKTVERDFDGGRWSADAGVLLRKDIEDQRGRPRALAAVLADPRDARRLPFPSEDLLKQRGGQSAAGSEEAHDSHALRDDPICQLRRERLPATGAPLASHATSARFAHRVARPERSRRALGVLEHCRASYDSRPNVIVLDVEAPADRGHGAQAQPRYDGSAGGYCFLPFPR